ncbi:unnamed protein product [Vitrella brassicaformis CCMP3155]|uniref:Uncharacterized protein n=5 Tax=Vitrella brassicaformis TaxID=1169539 RepID=A0A0G4G9T9_VITBC|nr:unnamed protein product [Vitrella brassicaformis CCMP3155]|eukprot:CEM25746.1 unnamed protein product [Vitrella brassicaformis CCMP3155]
MIMKHVLSHIPTDFYPKAAVRASQQLCHPPLPWQDIPLGTASGKKPPKKDEPFLTFAETQETCGSRLDHAIQFTQENLIILVTRMSMHNKRLSSRRRMSVGKKSRTILAPSLLQTFERLESTILSAVLLILARYFLDKRDLSPDDTLAFHGVDHDRGSQLMDLIGKELGVDMPAEWVRKDGTITNLSTHIASFVKGGGDEQKDSQEADQTGETFMTEVPEATTTPKDIFLGLLETQIDLRALLNPPADAKAVVSPPRASRVGSFRTQDAIAVMKEVASAMRAQAEQAVLQTKTEAKPASLKEVSEATRQRRVRETNRTALLSKTSMSLDKGAKMNQRLATVSSLCQRLFGLAYRSKFDHAPFVQAVVLSHLVIRALLMRVVYNRAAQTIQVVFRYHRKRKVEMRLLRPTICIQKCVRSLIQCTRLADRHAAATLIQRNWRAVRSRRRNLYFKQCVTFIQAVWRGALQRKWIADHVEAAKERRTFGGGLQLVYASVTIQRHFRGHLVRSVFKAEGRDSIRKILSSVHVVNKSIGACIGSIPISIPASMPDEAPTDGVSFQTIVSSQPIPASLIAKLTPLLIERASQIATFRLQLRASRSEYLRSLVYKRIARKKPVPQMSSSSHSSNGNGDQPSERRDVSHQPRSPLERWLRSSILQNPLRRVATTEVEALQPLTVESFLLKSIDAGHTCMKVERGSERAAVIEGLDTSALPVACRRGATIRQQRTVIEAAGKEDEEADRGAAPAMTQIDIDKPLESIIGRESEAAEIPENAAADVNLLQTYCNWLNGFRDSMGPSLGPELAHRTVHVGKPRRLTSVYSATVPTQNTYHIKTIFLAAALSDEHYGTLITRLSADKDNTAAMRDKAESLDSYIAHLFIMQSGAHDTVAAGGLHAVPRIVRLFLPKFVVPSLENLGRLFEAKMRKEADDPSRLLSARWQTCAAILSCCWRHLFAHTHQRLTAKVRGPARGLPSLAIPFLFSALSRHLQQIITDLTLVLWELGRNFYTTKYSKYRGLKSRIPLSAKMKLVLDVLGGKWGVGVMPFGETNGQADGRSCRSVRVPDPTSHTGEDSGLTLSDFLQQMSYLFLCKDALQHGIDFADKWKQAHLRRKAMTGQHSGASLPTSPAARGRHHPPDNAAIDSFMDVTTEDKRRDDELSCLMSYLSDVFAWLGERRQGTRSALAVSLVVLLALRRGLQPLLKSRTKQDMERIRKSHAIKGQLPPPDEQEDFRKLVASNASLPQQPAPPMEEGAEDTFRVARAAQRPSAAVSPDSEAVDPYASVLTPTTMPLLRRLQAFMRGALLRRRRNKGLRLANQYCKALGWPSAHEPPPAMVAVQPLEAAAAAEVPTSLAKQLTRLISYGPARVEGAEKRDLLPAGTRGLEAIAEGPALPIRRLSSGPDGTVTLEGDDRVCSELLCLVLWHVGVQARVHELVRDMQRLYGSTAELYSQLMREDASIKQMTRDIAKDLESVPTHAVTLVHPAPISEAEKAADLAASAGAPSGPPTKAEAAAVARKQPVGRPEALEKAKRPKQLAKQASRTLAKSEPPRKQPPEAATKLERRVTRPSRPSAALVPVVPRYEPGVGLKMSQQAMDFGQQLIREYGEDTTPLTEDINADDIILAAHPSVFTPSREDKGLGRGLSSLTKDDALAWMQKELGYRKLLEVNARKFGLNVGWAAGGPPEIPAMQGAVVQRGPDTMTRILYKSRLFPLWACLQPVEFLQCRMQIIQMLNEGAQIAYLEHERNLRFAACFMLLGSSVCGNLNILGDPTHLCAKPLLIEMAFQLLVGYIIISLRPSSVAEGRSVSPDRQASHAAVPLLNDVPLPPPPNAQTLAACRFLQMAVGSLVGLSVLHTSRRATLEAYLFDAALSVAYFLPANHKLQVAAESYFQQCTQRYLSLSQPVRYMRACLRYAAVLHCQRLVHEAEHFITKALGLLAESQKASKLSLALNHNAAVAIASSRAPLDVRRACQDHMQACQDILLSPARQTISTAAVAHICSTHALLERSLPISDERTQE